jgi:ribose-phosphate pyrophosphokinase
MSSQRAPLSLLACSSGKTFAEKIAKELTKKYKTEIHTIDSSEITFANTEIKTVINESIRGKEVVIVQDVENGEQGLSIDENLRALYTAIDACRRCDAEYVTCILPAFPYARQDKQDGREGITAARVAWELEGDLGTDHIVTIDLHNNAIQGFFRKAQIDNLRGSHVLVPFLKKEIKNKKDTVIMPTDLGGAKKANYYAQQLGCDIAFAYKERHYSKPNSIAKLKVMGDLKDKDVYIVDDMICTGGTLVRAAEQAKKAGAKNITAVTTLSLFNGPAIERLEKAHKEGILNRVVGTDASYIPEDLIKNSEWYEELSVAEYFAEIISRINTRSSISDILD